MVLAKPSDHGQYWQKHVKRLHSHIKLITFDGTYWFFMY
jgi:hypothetical protein